MGRSQILSVFLLFTCFFTFAQKPSPIPEIEFLDSVNGEFPMYKQFGLRNNEDLIIKFFEVSDFKSEVKLNHIVFQNNGKVKLFETYGFSFKSSVKVNKRRVKRKHREKYWSFLDSIIANKVIYFDKDELTKPSFPMVNDSINQNVEFIDHYRICIVVFKGNKYLGCSVRAPYNFDKPETPGIKDKLEFKNLYDELITLFEAS